MTSCSLGYSLCWPPPPAYWMSQRIGPLVWNPNHIFLEINFTELSGTALPDSESNPMQSYTYSWVIPVTGAYSQLSTVRIATPFWESRVWLINVLGPLEEVSFKRKGKKGREKLVPFPSVWDYLGQICLLCYLTKYLYQQRTFINSRFKVCSVLCYSPFYLKHSCGWGKGEGGLFLQYRAQPSSTTSSSPYAGWGLISQMSEPITAAPIRL